MARMNHDVVTVTVKGVMPTANGCAVFLGDETKTFVIYVDHSVGNAIQMTIEGVKKDRPLTHDLIGSIMLGLDTRLDHVVINDAHEGTYFARIILRMETSSRRRSSRSTRARATPSFSPCSRSARCMFRAGCSTPPRT